ncbi:hypothetical protein RCL_jg28800.t1 [Rhizophagus clarus]|uniref:Uncharacterized protein n=1 Tax=Rhizophagus clarus TaxID=94130 RepID=A0A8H3LUE9_9GLOM|nr:hypothetical protein RCL_jg28800.t1 [Rhizophagus clarus]
MFLFFDTKANTKLFSSKIENFCINDLLGHFTDKTTKPQTKNTQKHKNTTICLISRYLYALNYFIIMEESSFKITKKNNSPPEETEEKRIK